MTAPGGGLAELAQRLQDACITAGLTVATAESCTGGSVAQAITARPGASAYFLGGVVSYANEVKRDVLGVPADLLAAHGAVSPQVAVAMANGARQRVGADVAVGVTGIAGPDGGTAEKPVGLVYLAIVDGVGADVRRFRWSGDRAENIEWSVTAALELLLERVAGHAPTDPLGAR